MFGVSDSHVWFSTNPELKLWRKVLVSQNSKYKLLDQK